MQRTHLFWIYHFYGKEVASMGIFDLLSGKREKLKELQEFLIPGSTTKKLLSERELMRIATQRFENDKRIIADSGKILKTTKNRDTFDSRLSLVKEHTESIIMLSKYMKIQGASKEDLEKSWEETVRECELGFRYRVNEEIRKLSIPYYDTMEKVEAAWGVLRNLDLCKSEQAKEFEKICKGNIRQFKKYISKAKELIPDYEQPKYVPAYVRLAMLYEKQEKFEKAIEVCAEAIQMGAHDDHNKSRMYGRLARIIKKSGIQVEDEIKNLMLESNTGMIDSN